MIARRLRIAFLNVQAADEILPKVIQIMGDDLGWDEERRQVRHSLKIRRHAFRIFIRHVKLLEGKIF